MREITDIFKAISEQNRVRILLMLLHKSLCVCEIKSILNISTPTVSSHLNILRKAGFIEDTKDGKWINYRIKQNITNQVVIDLLDSLVKWYADTEIMQNDLAQIEHVDRIQLTCNN